MAYNLLMSIDVFSIGGGDIGSLETLALDRMFVERTGKERPNVLFVPTASDDSIEYVDAFTRLYGGILGCGTDALRLWGSDGDAEKAESKLRSADAIYVGGGNTKKMLECWRSFGLDIVFSDLAKKGIPIGGLSAGAICWYRVGNSDWPQYEGIPGVNTAPLAGLGFVDLAICPHTKNEGFRLSEFREMMKSVEGAGIGVDDCCALHVLGDRYRVVACQDGACAHLIQWLDGEMREREIQPSLELRSMTDLTFS